VTHALVTPAREIEDVERTLVCTAVNRVTHDVADFVLAADEPTRFSFEPGQHLTVTVPVDGQRLSRCYSLSSPPTRPDNLTITVKRVPGGPVSNWLHDHLRPGDPLEVAGPLGSFSPAGDRSAKQLYLTAGSGITPLMSAARTLIDEGGAADVVLVHHARNPDDIVFRDELDRMSERHPGIRVAVVCEDDAPTQPWAGRRGRISVDLLADVVPDAAQREVFLCGPPPYMAAARTCLSLAGVDPARVHEESYVFGGVSSPAVVRTAAVTTYSLELRRSGRVVDCPSGTTILEAASRAALTLPSSCQEGVCGTCKTTMLSGAVDMNHGGGIRQREIDRGQILLCCATPTEDLVLDA
jgi:glycine betaine catabolism B